MEYPPSGPLCVGSYFAKHYEPQPLLLQEYLILQMGESLFHPFAGVDILAKS